MILVTSPTQDVNDIIWPTTAARVLTLTVVQPPLRTESILLFNFVIPQSMFGDRNKALISV